MYFILTLEDAAWWLLKLENTWLILLTLLSFLCCCYTVFWPWTSSCYCHQSSHSFLSATWKQIRKKRVQIISQIKTGSTSWVFLKFSVMNLFLVLVTLTLFSRPAGRLQMQQELQELQGAQRVMGALRLRPRTSPATDDCSRRRRRWTRWGNFFFSEQVIQDHFKQVLKSK